MKYFLLSFLIVGSVSAQTLSEIEAKRVLLPNGWNLTHVGKNIELGDANENFKIELSKFSELVEKITKKNIFRPYPDINDTPN